MLLYISFLDVLRFVVELFFLKNIYRISKIYNPVNILLYICSYSLTFNNNTAIKLNVQHNSFTPIWKNSLAILISMNLKQDKSVNLVFWVCQVSQ